MTSLRLSPISRLSGTLALPGSKSLSNRILLLAALADGPTTIGNLLASDDVYYMRTALSQLGVAIEPQDNASSYRISGVAGNFPVKHAQLFLGNAGTAFRPLTAVLALSNGQYHLSGVPRMHERPIGDLVNTLRLMGASIDYVGTPDYPPLEIGKFHNKKQRMTLSIQANLSSQFLTAVLLALPLLKQHIEVIVEGKLISQPYVQMTVELMRRFGVTVEQQHWQRFTIPENSCYRSPGNIRVEGDASSASYFLAAGALSGGPVRVTGVGKTSIQGDVRFADVLATMGADVQLGEDWIEVSSTGTLSAIDADLNHIPDAAMTLAVIALAAQGTTTIRNIGSWRVKETDRLTAMATELRKLGAQVRVADDSIRITPPTELKSNISIDTYDDHRLAMCFSLVSLMGVPVIINEPDCVSKTYPAYFEDFLRLSQRS